MKFVADGMLGKITRWLRILGQDVEYFNQLGDSELMDVAREDDRVLLTRDLELYKRAEGKGLAAYYLDGKTEPERIAELVHQFNIPLDIDMEKSRCPVCNTKIEPIAKKEIVNKLETNTIAFYDFFWICSKCGKIYWQGAHWGGIQETLKKAKSILKKYTVA